MLNLIWAQDKNGLIGKDDKLPWSVPTDLKFFKETTMGKTIVMGRKTFQGMGERLLPGRKTIVLTKDENYKKKGATVYHDLSKVLALAQTEEVFITGGSQLYQAFFPYADYLYETQLLEEFCGDTYFPQVDFSNFILKDSKKFFDEKSQISGEFRLYQKK